VGRPGREPGTLGSSREMAQLREPASWLVDIVRGRRDRVSPARAWSIDEGCVVADRHLTLYAVEVLPEEQSRG